MKNNADKKNTFFYNVIIQENIFLYIKNFFVALPIGTESPDIGEEPDGSMTLEWYRSPNHVLSVSFNDDGHVHYAAIVNGNGIGGDFSMRKEPFNIPPNLLDIINKITRGE